MSTQFTNRQWRLPNNENKDKQSNYSMDFGTAANNGINCGTVPTMLIGDSSVSIWFKSEVANSNNVIFGRHQSGSGNTLNRYVLRTELSGSGVKIKLELGTSGGDFYSQNVYSKSVWHHLVCTLSYSGGQYTVKFYVDGVEDSPTNSPMTKSSMTSNNTMPLIIGGMWNWNSTITQGCRGLLDGVAIYNYALSSSQITTLYGSSSTGIGNPMSLSPKPVAYYPLGDQDAFNGANYLVPNSSLKDYVFDFDSSSNYINCGNNLNLTNALTVSLWVKINSAFPDNIGPVLASQDTGSGTTRKWGIIHVYGNLTIQTWANSGTQNPQINISSSTIESDNKWSHIVFTVDGTTNTNGIKAYLNKVNVSSVTANGTGLNSNPNTNLIIGGYESSYRLLNGEISNFQIFDTALSSTEIETLYNNGSPIKTLANIPQSSNLKAWYKLDASEVYDSATTEWSIDNNQNPSAYPSSLNFTNDVVQSAFPAPASLNSSVFSYSIWVKVLTSAGFEEVLMGNFSGTGADIRFKGNENRIYFRTSYSNQTYQDEALVDDGGWHHIVATCDGTNLKIYVDKAKGTDGTGSYTSNTRVFKVGGGTQGNMQNVLISNACYFNTALSQSEIDTLYNNGTPLTDMSSFSSLVSWWKLNNMSAGIQDSKGSNNLSGSGPTEYAGFVNALAGDSSGMSQANLIQSDLSFTSGYSPYALDFDAASSDYIDFNSIDLGTTNTISFWHKRGATSNQYVLGSTDGTQKYIVYFTPNYIYIRPDGSTQFITTYLGNTPYPFPPYNNTTDWASYIITRSGDNIKLYLNSVEFALSGSGSGMAATTVNRIGTRGNSVSNTIDGSISNVSVWNTALTSAQVTEIYNEGVPSNLNNHSAYSNLVSWWQLGSNTSWVDPYWIALDEKGTNNGQSQNVAAPNNMGENAIVDGVGSYANGLSSGMGGDEVIGDAPYSSSNALSVNMDVLDRVTDTPS